MSRSLLVCSAQVETLTGLITEAASPVASATTFWPQDRWDCHDSGVEISSSRILLRPADPDQSRRFYRDVLGLAVYREFGSPLCGPVAEHHADRPSSALSQGTTGQLAMVEIEPYAAPPPEVSVHGPPVTADPIR